MSSTSAPATTERQGATPTEFIEIWEPKLNEAEGMLQPCRAEPYGRDCAQRMKNLETLAERLAFDADGSGFTELKATANEVREKARKWYTECQHSDPGTELRSDCVVETWGVVGAGVKQMKAEMFATTVTN